MSLTKNTKLFILFFLCSLLATSITNAQKWDLGKCISHAKEHNPALQKQKLNLKQAQVRYDATSYMYFPDIHTNVASGNHSGMFIDPTTNILDFGHSFVNSIRITSELHIFNSFTNKYYKNRRAEQLNIRQLEYKKRVQFLNLNIIQAFYAIALQRANIEMIKERQATLAKRKRFIEGSVEAGLLHRRELLFFEYLMAQDETNLLKAQNDISQTLFRLTQLMGVPQHDGFDIETSALELMPEVLQVVDYNTAIGEAQSHFPHLKIGEALLSYAENNLLLTKTALWPSLSLEGALGTKTSTSNVNVDFGNQLMDNNYQYIGLNLNIPIYNRHKTRTEVALADIEVEAARISALQLALELEKLVYEAVLNYQNAVKVFEAQQKKYEGVKEEFHFASRSFDLGNIGIYELSEVTSRLITTENNLLKARFEVLINSKILDLYRGRQLF